MPVPLRPMLPGAVKAASAAIRPPTVRNVTTMSSSRSWRPCAMKATAVQHTDPSARLSAKLRYLSQHSQHPQGADKASAPPTAKDASAPSSPSSSSSSESGAESQPKKRQSMLDQMGATRTVKIVVIVFIGIYGTMETIFYANALYRYLTQKPEP